MEPVSTSGAFDEASQAVVAYLTDAVPLGMWAVTRYDGEQQVYLTVGGGSPGLSAGDGVPWEQTLCQHSVAGVAPPVIADAGADPHYARTDFVRSGAIATFVGMPILAAGGDVFGTLCGYDPDAQEQIAAHAGLFELLTTLLGHVLDADLQRAAARREAALAETVSETDSMTGLLNRRGWDRLLAVHDARCRVFGDPAAVVVVDLDGLKQLNDTEGHAAGDRLIRHAAATIRRTVRSHDVVARLGGDEFGVLASVTAGEAVALTARLQRSFDAAGVAASIGSSRVSARDGVPAAWAAADAAMYVAKAARKDGSRAAVLVSD
jgi:diguanylate cyclase (GGDEF)-like protein